MLVSVIFMSSNFEFWFWLAEEHPTVYTIVTIISLTVFVGLIVYAFIDSQKER